MIFSKHRRKLEPRRRFGSPTFRSRLRQAAAYKRTFNMPKYRFRVPLLPPFSRRRIKFISAAAFILVFYYSVVSGKLLITEVAVKGGGQVSYEQVKEVLDAASNSRLFLIPRNHFFLMTRGRLNRLMTKTVPEVREVTKVNRSWPNKIEIEISERNPGFVLSMKERKFLVDEEGLVLKEVTDEKGLPLVVNENQDQDVVLGEILSNPKLVAFIQSMHRAWPSKIDSRISSIKITSKNSFESQFTSEAGWSVFFDVSRPVAVQLAGLSLMINKHIPAKDKSNLAYIDMRSEKWVYYCFKGTACASLPSDNLQGEQNSPR